MLSVNFKINFNYNQYVQEFTNAEDKYIDGIYFCTATTTFKHII